VDAISARNLAKTYRIGVGRARVREMLPWPFDHAVARAFPRWWLKDTFDALDDVTLTVETGSSVGIVGHNGAGKTTLLKVISGVTEPTRGTISTSGRIAALLDVLVGFHQELTGRENAYLLGAMQGFGRRAMTARMDDIFEFAEIDDAADTPLKRYSAGMVARLGFGIFASIDVDTLLVDEVLAVGDAAFQRKCIRWLDEFRTGGGTLLFVSHNLGLVRTMTERVVWLDHGTVKGDGPTASVLGDYARAMEHRQVEDVRGSRKQVKKLMVGRGLQRWGAGGARVEEVHVEGPSRDGVEISIAYDASEVAKAVFCIGFVDEMGQEVGATASPSLATKGHRGEVSCQISPLPFRSGVYFPVVAILSPEGLVRDRWKLDRAIVVDRNGDDLMSREFGPVAIDADWALADGDAP
jgi:ABC-type polysaccharide/polyol phosphate transport system ATPase subunit